MTDSDIEAKVIDLVAEHLGVEKSQLTRDTNFATDLHADSLDTVEMIMSLEDEFDTSIPDEDAEKIKTVGEAVDFIVANRSS